MTDPLDRQSPSGRRLPTPAAFVPVPLSSAFYVDLATVVPFPDRNGAIVTPFAALEDALAIASNGDVIALTPTVGGGAYAAQVVQNSLTIQAINAAPEPSFLNAGNPTVVTKCTGFSLPGTLACSFVGLQITSLDVASAASTVLLAACKVQSLTSVTSIDTPLYLQDCIFGSFSSAGSFARSCAFNGGVDIEEGAATLFDCVVVGAFEQTGDAFTCELHGTRVTGGNMNLEGALLLQDGCNVGNVAALGVDIADSNCGGTITTTGAFSAHNAVITGAVVVGGDADIRNTVLGGNLTVTGALTIDSVSYLSALQSGHTVSVTGALTVVGNPNPTVKSIGYTFAAPLVLTVMPAGHAPGIYEVTLFSVIRTAGTSSSTTTALTFSAPTLGATSVNFGPPQLTPVGVQLGSPRDIVSSGATAMVFTITPAAVVGSPVVDVYAVANRVGTL